MRPFVRRRIRVVVARSEIAPSFTFDGPRHKRARFGETVRKAYLCISEKRNGAGFSFFRIFRADYLIRAAKTILYERENYKQERENLLGDNFCDVL